MFVVRSTLSHRYMTRFDVNTFWGTLDQAERYYSEDAARECAKDMGIEDYSIIERIDQ